MWYSPLNTKKHLLVNNQGRVLGRVIEKDGEFSASIIQIDNEGLGSRKVLGRFVALNHAKNVIESELNLPVQGVASTVEGAVAQDTTAPPGSAGVMFDLDFIANNAAPGEQAGGVQQA